MIILALAFAISAATQPSAAAPLQVPTSQPPTGVEVPTGDTLRNAIVAASDGYFALAFEQCDPRRFGSLLAEGFEFYHDRAGRSVGGEREVRLYAENCRQRSEPDAVLTRRELVPGSQRVFPIPRYGAIEEGEHLFYRRNTGKPEQLISRAKYIHIWSLTPQGWRLARVVSYAHESLRAPSKPAPLR